MFTVSDLVLFTSVEPASYKSLKSWWDHVISLTLLGHFLLTIVVWFIQTSKESGGMICVPLNTNPWTLDTSLARYTISQCQKDIKAWRLIYYPVGALLEWFILYVVHSFWVVLPRVQSKMESISQIFNEFRSFDFNFILSNGTNNMLPDICLSNNNSHQCSIIHDKIVLLLMGHSSIAKSYLIKVTTLSIFTLIFMACNFYYLYLPLFDLNFFPVSDFLCSLEDEIRNTTIDFSCCLSSILYIYLIGAIHLIMFIVIFIFNIWSIFWFLSIQQKFFDANNIYSIKNEHLKGLPGYSDFRFYTCLMSHSVIDGGIFFELLRKVVMINTKEFVSKHTEDRILENKQNCLGVREFDDEYLLSEKMCYYLGLNFPKRLSKMSLLDTIEYLYNKINSVDFMIVLPIEQRLINELNSDLVHYKNLYETNYGNRLNTDCCIDPGLATSFFSLIGSLSKKVVEPFNSDFIFHVSSIFLNSSIFVLKPKQINSKIKFLCKEDIENDCKSFYICCLSNGSYITLEESSINSKQHKKSRLKFWNDNNFRSELHKFALNQISRQTSDHYLISDSIPTESVLAQNKTVRNRLYLQSSYNLFI